MKLEVELTKAHEPSQELLNFVKAHFGIRDNALVELSVSNEALIHRQLIGRQDVVRYRDDTNENVGEVWFHAEFSVDDEGPFNISVVFHLDTCVKEHVSDAKKSIPDPIELDSHLISLLHGWWQCAINSIVKTFRIQARMVKNRAS